MHRFKALGALLVLPAIAVCSGGGGDDGGPAAGPSGSGDDTIYPYEPDGDSFIDADKTMHGDGGAGGTSGAGGGGTCDDAKGDFGACDAIADGGAASCLTGDLCGKLPMLLAPRLAGVAMTCLASFDAMCTDDDRSGCIVSAALDPCESAAPGSQPCDALANVCSTDDPLGAMSECLAIAAALMPTAITTMESCLSMATACDPAVIDSCALTLLE